MKTNAGTLQPEEVAHIARELKVKPEEVLEMEARMSGHEIPLDPQVDDDVEDAYSPISYLQNHQPEPSDLLRSEEHTSELQSLMRISYAVFCLKKTKNKS